MTPAEIARLLAEIARRWHDKPLPEAAANTYLADMPDLPAAEALAAIEAYAATGNQWPPKSAWVRAEALRALQGPPPPFDELLAFVAKQAILLPYGETNTPEHTAEAIATLEACGAHEALLRFVAARGVYAVQKAPDPTLWPLDQSMQASRRDLARAYEQIVIPAWEGDPEPGQALNRACDRARVDVAVARELAAARLHHLQRRVAAAARLELPPGDPPAGETMMTGEDALEAFRAERVKIENARRDERAARAAARSADAAQRRAALAELAEKGAGR